jgi:hypothetical protein
MKNTESNTPQSGRGRCSRCSKQAINSCAGCLGAPGYGNEQLPQRTFYCSKECQKAHWSTHKAECKVFQTRRSLHRAAAVLEAVIDVVDAKGEKAVMRLGVFVTELFNGESRSFRAFDVLEIPMMESSDRLIKRNRRQGRGSRRRP